MPDSKDVHQKLIEKSQELASSSSPLLAIFDLDSTLFNVSHRTQQILLDFSNLDHINKKHPKAAEQLKAVQVEDRDWGIRQSLIRSQIEASIDFFEELRFFWRDHFFSSHYLHLDQPYPGAVEFVQSVAQAGASILYLTGRDRRRMGEGTIKSLNQWNFPVDKEGKHLLMKPDKDLFDEEFKKDTLLEMNPHERDIWFFENEPVIIKSVREHCPNIKIIFIDSVHSGRESTPEDLPKILMHFRQGE